MSSLHANNFGLIIAYIVPGFITLCGAAHFSPPVATWLSVEPSGAPTVSGFLFGSLASVGAGLLVNAVRWKLVDPIHFATGVPRKNWHYGRLSENVRAFELLLTNQFRYYEAYANSFVAIGFTYAVLLALAELQPWTISIFLAVQAVLWLAARSTLINYHTRIAAFLGTDSR